MLTSLLSNVPLLAAATAVLVTVQLVNRRPVIGIWLSMASYLLFTFGSPISFWVGSIQVHPQDAVVAVLALAMLSFPRRITTLPVPLLILLGLLVVWTAAGVVSSGPQEAVAGARWMVYPLVAMAFAGIHFREKWETLSTVFVASASFLAVVALYNVSQLGFLSYAVAGDRPLNGGQALIVSQAAFFLLLTKRPSPVNRVLIIALLVILILSQQRTVWLTTLAMAGAVVLSGGSNHTSGIANRTKQVLLGAIAAMGLFVALALPSELGESLAFAVDMPSDGGTFGWRIDSASALLTDYLDANVFNQLLGRPTNVGFDRVVDGILIEVQPHNMYVAVLISFGVVGLVALVWLLKSAAMSWKSSIGVVFAAGLAVFCLAYQLESPHGLILGAALFPRIAPAERPIRKRGEVTRT